jgi:hypothetical protein
MNKGWVLRPVPLKIKVFLKFTALYNEIRNDIKLRRTALIRRKFATALSFNFLSFSFQSIIVYVPGLAECTQSLQIYLIICEEYLKTLPVYNFCTIKYYSLDKVSV